MGREADILLDGVTKPVGSSLQPSTSERQNYGVEIMTPEGPQKVPVEIACFFQNNNMLSLLEECKNSLAILVAIAMGKDVDTLLREAEAQHDGSSSP